MNRIEILESIADVAENLVYSASGVEECFNPSEYFVDATYLTKLSELLKQLSEVE